MSDNAKNRLLELLADLGCTETHDFFQPATTLPSGLHSCTAIVRFPDGRVVRGTGEGARIRQAEVAAAQSVLDQLHHNHPDLLIDWEAIKVEAQAGDALIKLGVYLSEDFESAEDKSKRLQELESDSHLSKVFDQWKAQGDPALIIWGDNLGEKRKATLIEAMLWRRFGMKVITLDAPIQLQSLLKTLL